jgi:iron complex transport system permease protein
VIRALNYRLRPLAVRRRQVVLYWLVLLLPFPLAIYAIGVGRYPIPPEDVLRVLVNYVAAPPADPDITYNIVTRIRLPRIAAAMLIGANLSVTGAAFQGIFRNPLVDSNILGVTSGAGFGAALMLLILPEPAGEAVIEFFQSLVPTSYDYLIPKFAVQISAFVFGLVAVMLAYFISRLYYSAPLLVLTLVGILIGSFFGSLTSLLKYVADPLDSLPAITYWLLGGLTDVTRNDIPALAVVSLLGMIFMWGVRWRLNVLSLGDHEAATLGLNPARLKLLIILWSTLMTAMAVSVGGVIGWVGLVIPHAVRTLVGPDHQRLVPASVAMGAVFLLLIDTLSRTLWANEIPLGVFTGVVGVPLLLLILRVNKTGWQSS